MRSFSGFPGKESACNVGDPGSILESERCSGEEMATHSTILAWRIPWTEESGQATVHGATKSYTLLSTQASMFQKV